MTAYACRFCGSVVDGGLFCDFSCYAGAMDLRGTPVRGGVRRARVVRCSCGNDFVTTSGGARFCHQCRPRAPELETLGCYVYVWKDAGQIFYVGRGQRDRAVAPHYTCDRLAVCERLRRESVAAGRFSIEIVSSGLTKEGAELVESALIIATRPRGNVRSVSTRAVWSYCADEVEP